MKKITFIHTADLHLGTPFRGLSSVDPDLADKLKSATYQAFHRIVDLCIAEQVDFLIIAGDVFDSEYQSLTAQLMLFRGLQRLADHGIHAYIIAGNHDPFPEWSIPDDLNNFVHLFGPEKVEKKAFFKGETHLASLYGISFQKEKVKKNLSKLYKSDMDGAPFSIALLHGTVGNPGSHEEYAPFKLNDILNERFDYWALGHIHKHQILRRDFPAVVYAGNPQGRDFGEKGSRGCYKVILTENKAPEIEFLPVQTIRFEELTIDCSGLNSVKELEQIISRQFIAFLNDENSSVNLMVRIQLIGSTSLHSKLQNEEEIKEWQDQLNEDWGSSEPFIWIDKIIVKTSPEVELDSLRHQSDFLGDLMKEFDTLMNDNEAREQLFESIDSIPGIRKVLKDEYHLNKEEILEKAKWLILEKLIRDNS